jgi:hypothetical protein
MRLLANALYDVSMQNNGLLLSARLGRESVREPELGGVKGAA